MTSRPFLFKKMDQLTKKVTTRIVVVSGTARGADQLGEAWARARGHAIEQFPADWENLGRSAGYRRNVEMVATLKERDAVVAFWDGKSKGTKHTIDIASALPGIKVIVVRYE